MKKHKESHEGKKLPVRIMMKQTRETANVQGRILGGSNGIPFLTDKFFFNSIKLKSVLSHLLRDFILLKPFFAAILQISLETTIFLQ